MSGDPLHNMDLNLLLVFDAMMEEGSATRVAARLGRSQPAISAALARLRALFDDPLFIRMRQGMLPTARAIDLAASIRPVLGMLREAMESRVTFEPASAAQTFTVGALDDLELFVAPALMQRMTNISPLSRLRIRSITPRENLERDDVDVVLTVLREKPPGWMSHRALAQAGYLLLFDPRQAHGGDSWTMDEYLAARHLLVSFSGDFEGVSDVALAKLGLARRVAAVTPRFSSAGAMVRGTNLVVTLPSYIARALAAVHGLAALPVPFELPPVTLSLCWRRRMDSDPGHLWFRTLLADVFEERWREGELSDGGPPAS